MVTKDLQRTCVPPPGERVRQGGDRGGDLEERMEEEGEEWEEEGDAG